MNATEVASLRSRYVGRRIRLTQILSEGTRLAPGLLGIVQQVDDDGNLHVVWENGIRRNVIPGVDWFEPANLFKGVRK